MSESGAPLFSYHLVFVMVGGPSDQKMHAFGMAPDPRVAAEMGVQMTAALKGHHGGNWRVLLVEEQGPCSFGPVAQPDIPLKLFENLPKN